MKQYESRLNLVVHSSAIEANGIKPIILNDDDSRVIIIGGFAEKEVAEEFIEYRFGHRDRVLRDLGFLESSNSTTWKILESAVQVPGVLIYFLNIPDKFQLRGHDGVVAMLEYVSDTANRLNNEYWKDLLTLRKTLTPDRPVLDILHA